MEENIDSGLPLSAHPSMDATHTPACETSIDIIRHLQTLQSETVEIRQRTEYIQNVEEQIAAVLTVQDHILRSLHRLHKVQKRKKKKSQQVHRQPSVTEQCKLTKEEITTIVHLPEALQANILKIMNNVLLVPTNISDKLIEEDCLSEDEGEYIRGLPTPKDQIRSLVRKLKGRGPRKIKIFLELVRKDHPQLVEDIYSTLDRIKEQRRDFECEVCLMVKMVDLQDIADYLWQEDVISDDLHGHITEIEGSYRYRQYYWTRIISCINNSTQPATTKLVLIDALAQKYDYLSELLGSKTGLLECCCNKKRKYMSAKRSFDGSQTDVSEYGRNVPQLSQIDTSASDTDYYSSLDQGTRKRIFSAANRGSYTSDERSFSSIQGSIDNVRTTEVTDTSQRQRGRHGSGQFAPEQSEQCESLNSLHSIANIGEQIMTPNAHEMDTRPTFHQHDDWSKPRPVLHRSDHANEWSTSGLGDVNGNDVSDFDQRDIDNVPRLSHSMSNTSTVKPASESGEDMSLSTDNSTSPDTNTTDALTFIPTQQSEQYEDRTCNVDEDVHADDEGEAVVVTNTKKKSVKRQRQKRLPRHRLGSLTSETSCAYDYRRQTSMPSAFRYSRSRKTANKHNIAVTTEGRQEKRKLSSHQTCVTMKTTVQDQPSHQDRSVTRESNQPEATEVVAATTCDAKTMYEIDETSAQQLELMNRLGTLSIRNECADTDPDLTFDDGDTDGVGNMTV